MKLNFVTADDWQGLYIDGNLVLEGHSLSIKSILDILNIKHHSVEVDDEWMQEEGRLPERIEDIVIKHP